MRQRWASTRSEPVIAIATTDLERHGIVGLARRHATTPAVIVASLLASGVLPRHLRRYERLLADLCELDHLSHSAAARQLHVTRWTVAAWRKRLGITPVARAAPNTAAPPTARPDGTTPSATVRHDIGRAGA